MVDFFKHLSSPGIEKKTDPIEIYQGLDRASDKGPLRPAQEFVLERWSKDYRSQKDVVLKLHTGQGKTVIGLLILQSKINEGAGPALYLCPNNYLVAQTMSQAKQFGVKVCTAPDDIPDEFWDSTAILVTSVQKLFNGLSKFGINAKSRKVGAVLLDDAHACLDAIRDAFTISIPKDAQPYRDLLNLFTDSLRDQGAGDYEDIKSGKDGSVLAVPYWDVDDKKEEITRILAKYSEADYLKFKWPLLKNELNNCLYLITGSVIQITPYLPQVNIFGSYASASHRVFMSATISDDSFLVKGAGVASEAVQNPLIYDREKWSGEKMVLIPSLIDDNLNRAEVVHHFAKSIPKRNFGVVAIVPSFESCKDWQSYGALVAKKDTINNEIEKLKAGNCENPLIIVNRYDGIDLPDSSCRILIVDSKPFSESLVDRYNENCRGDSDSIQIKLAQTIEQGMGRHIRGEKDYGVVLIIGSSLVKAIRAQTSRRFFSAQTKQQIEIGLKATEYAKQEIGPEKPAMDVFLEVINQCLNRDESWKSFYTVEMEKMESRLEAKMLERFVIEKKSEEAFIIGNVARGVELIENIILNSDISKEEKGWYLQEKARYEYRRNKTDSNKIQIAAHSHNRLLLKPRDGMQVETLQIGQKRIGNIRDWVSRFSGYSDLKLSLDEILEAFSFGTSPERFERAVDEIGTALGFSCQRPDKEWKSGPDNLWCIRDGEYVAIECKNDVNVDRKEIYKEETGQMNNACAWFEKNYPGAKCLPVLIIPASMLSPGAGFNKVVRLMRQSQMKKLKQAVKAFYSEFDGRDLKDLSDAAIEKSLGVHKLSVEFIPSLYSEIPKNVAR